MQFVGVFGLRPGFFAHARDGIGIQPADVGGTVRVEPAAGDHRLGAALLQRRVVEEGIGLAR